MRGSRSTLTALLGARRPLQVVLAATIVAGAAVRLHHLDGSRVNAEHQYQSALVARLAFFAGAESIPAWRKEVARAAVQRQRVLELPIVPYLSSLGYRIIGAETLVLPRSIAALAWLLGGALLFRLTTRLWTAPAGLVAAAYFMFVPSGVLLSVSFLPDSPMVMLMIASLLPIIALFERPTSARFAAAWVIATAAILVKPVALFPITGAVIGLALNGGVSEGWTKRLRLGVGLTASVAVSGSMYYAREILRGEELAVQAGVSFVPRLLLESSYWEGWLQSASWAVGFGPLVLGILGVAVMRPGPSRALVLGLWGGYVVYCLLFTYHIRFAGHYHLPLVPIVALSLAPFVAAALRRLRPARRSWAASAACVVAAVLVAYSSVRRIARVVDADAGFESPRTAAEIGDLVGHSTRTLFLAAYYGAPLQYFGELAGEWWPRSRQDPALSAAGAPDLSIADRLNALDFEPEYFIITDRDALRRHEADLAVGLAELCTLVAERPRYVIYELRDCLERLGNRTGIATRLPHAGRAVDSAQ